MEYVSVGLLVILLVFLIAREFWCWYFKINKAVTVLTDISSKLDVLIGVTDESNRLLQQNITEEESEE